MISYRDVVDTVLELLKMAETRLDPDITTLLEEAYKNEDNEIARFNLRNILDNIRIAGVEELPICQDTGIPIFFVELGRNVKLEFNIRDAITEGILLANDKIPLRPSTVHPLSRENSGNNLGEHLPLVYFDFLDETNKLESDSLKISVMAKGAGSENVSSLKMFLPSQTEEIPDYVTEVVKRAGGKPCPPVIVGVGIGTTFDGSAMLAKKALLRNIRSMSDYERKILRRINELGIGPMGMGGKATALAVLAEIGHCHTASLPVAVNIQCWANRKATMEVR